MENGCSRAVKPRAGQWHTGECWLAAEGSAPPTEALRGVLGHAEQLCGSSLASFCGGRQPAGSALVTSGQQQVSCELAAVLRLLLPSQPSGLVVPGTIPAEAGSCWDAGCIWVLTSNYVGEGQPHAALIPSCMSGGHSLAMLSVLPLYRLHAGSSTARSDVWKSTSLFCARTDDLLQHR